MGVLKLARKANIARKEGGLSLVRQRAKNYFSVVHNSIRPCLPVLKGYGMRNGVQVSGANIRFFDTIVPWHTAGIISDWKDSEYSELREFVECGDQVTIIGGGLGSNAVVAAREVGNSGNVMVYEGDSEKCAYINETIKINKLQSQCKVVNGFIDTGSQKDFSINAETETKRINPDSISTGDVLDLDVEGAELDIIRNLPDNDLPRVIIVQSHHMYNYCSYESSTALTKAIEEKGYDLVSEFSGPWVGTGFTAKLD